VASSDGFLPPLPFPCGDTDTCFRGPVPPPVSHTFDMVSLKEITHICAFMDGSLLVMLTFDHLLRDQLVKLIPQPSSSFHTTTSISTGTASLGGIKAVESKDKWLVKDMGEYEQGRTICVLPADDERFYLVLHMTSSGPVVSRMNAENGEMIGEWIVRQSSAMDTHNVTNYDVTSYRCVARGHNDQLWITTIGFGPAQVMGIDWDDSPISTSTSYQHLIDENKGVVLQHSLPIVLVELIATYVGVRFMVASIVAGESLRAGHVDGDAATVARFKAISTLSVHPIQRNKVFILDDFSRSVRLLQPTLTNKTRSTK
jgi:hypothetical protein